VRDGREPGLGIGLAFAGTAVATRGNLVSMRMQRDHLPILPSTAWGMGYGAVVVALAATLSGATWTFDTRWPYVVSLLYLTILGSIFAFAAYLSLLKVAGGVASFVGVATPVVAMLLSTVVEGYRWSWVAIAGVILAVIGNVVALRAPAGPVTRTTASPR